VIDLGFKVHPPLMGRSAGISKVQRIRGWLETNASKKKVKCKMCGNLGHFAKTCKLPEQGQDGQAAAGSQNKRFLLILFFFLVFQNCCYVH
jgi:hypothetical protein